MHLIRKRNKRLFTLCDHFQVACTFQVQKFRNDGTITYQGPEFSNLVLDVGLDLLNSEFYGLTDRSCNYINVGTGSSTPTTTQTGLDTFLAATGGVYSGPSAHYQTSSPKHKWQEATFEFAVGGCTGNLTEVGLSANSNADYFNRQLFKDESGNPTTITVLSDEGLRIATKLFFYGDIAPGDTETGSFLLNGSTTINFTRELTSANGWVSYSNGGVMANIGGATQATTSNESVARITASATDFGGGTLADATTKSTYTSGDYYWDAEYTWDPGTFVGDVASVLFVLPIWTGSAEYSAFRLSPVITLTDTDELKMTLRRSWGRYVA